MFAVLPAFFLRAHLFCFFFSFLSFFFLVERTPTLLWGVRPAAGERARAGPTKGSRVPVCTQGNARQDSRYGKSELCHFNASAVGLYCLNLSRQRVLLWSRPTLSFLFFKGLRKIWFFHLFQRNTSLPDDTNVARLQEELIGVKLREAEALTGLKELRQQVRDLEDHWQVSTKISARRTTWNSWSKPQQIIMQMLYTHTHTKLRCLKSEWILVFKKYLNILNLDCF